MQVAAQAPASSGNAQTEPASHWLRGLPAPPSQLFADRLFVTAEHPSTWFVFRRTCGAGHGQWNAALRTDGKGEAGAPRSFFSLSGSRAPHNSVLR